MTPNPQSVCKHCHEPITFKRGYFLGAGDTRYCAEHDGRHEPEPSEPASLNAPAGTEGNHIEQMREQLKAAGISDPLPVGWSLDGPVFAESEAQSPSDLVAEAFLPVYNAIDILQEKLLYLVSPDATPNALNDALLLLRRVCVRVAHKKDLNDVAKQIQDWLGRNDHNSIVRMAAPAPAEHQGVQPTRNSEVLASFVRYCQENPEHRFWQALCSWSGYQFIISGDLTGESRDTFYWEGKRHDEGK